MFSRLGRPHSDQTGQSALGDWWILGIFEQPADLLIIFILDSNSNTSTARNERAHRNSHGAPFLPRT